MGGESGNFFRGFNTVLLLNKNLETPKKERNLAKIEAEGNASPENAKYVTKYLFDSEQKERRERDISVTPFNLEAEGNTLDDLIDLLQTDEREGQGNTSFEAHIRYIN